MTIPRSAHSNAGAAESVRRPPAPAALLPPSSRWRSRTGPRSKALSPPFGLPGCYEAPRKALPVARKAFPRSRPGRCAGTIHFRFRFLIPDVEGSVRGCVVFVSFHHGVPWPGPESAKSDGAAHRILRGVSGLGGSGQNTGAKEQTGLTERSAEPHPVGPRGHRDRRKRGQLQDRWGGRRARADPCGGRCATNPLCA